MQHSQLNLSTHSTAQHTTAYHTTPHCSTNFITGKSLQADTVAISCLVSAYMKASILVACSIPSCTRDLSITSHQISRIMLYTFIYLLLAHDVLNKATLHDSPQLAG